MAATFVVETGTGSATANSYLSEADADTYHENHSGLDVWDAEAQADKEAALRLATQYLDVKYEGRWKGTKVNVSQALAWPRLCSWGADEIYIEYNVIPQKLKDACAELALKIIQGDTLLDDIDTPGDIKSESSVVGPIEEEITYVGGKGLTKKYPLVEGLLKPLLSGSDTLMSRG